MLGRGWLEEADRLRHMEVPGPDAQMPEVREALTAARACLDRLEEIYGQAMALASAARIAAREKTAMADDELDRRIAARAKQAYEYQGARERLAEASLDTLPLRQAARSAQKAADLATGIEQQVRLRYYGLLGLRDSLADRVRAFAFESNLDR